ncbi:hypothetical protein FDE94_15055 [Clostridium botulinum]|nr:hypothetical protein [Clostridium botulinum]
MKIGEILEVQQPNKHKNLKNNKYNKKDKKNEKSKEKLLFSDVVNLMKHDSYYRGKKGRIRQKTWGE